MPDDSECPIRAKLREGTNKTVCERCSKTVFAGNLSLTTIFIPGPDRWVCNRCFDELRLDAYLAKLREERERP